MAAAATLAAGIGKGLWPGGGMPAAGAALAPAHAHKRIMLPPVQPLVTSLPPGAVTLPGPTPLLAVPPPPPAPAAPPGGGSALQLAAADPGSLPGSFLLGSLAGSLGNLLGSLPGSALSLGELLGRGDSFEFAARLTGGGGPGHGPPLLAPAPASAPAAAVAAGSAPPAHVAAAAAQPLPRGGGAPA
jgi:hypothetical protein